MTYPKLGLGNDLGISYVEVFNLLYASLSRFNFIMPPTSVGRGIKMIGCGKFGTLYA